MTQIEKDCILFKALRSHHTYKLFATNQDGSPKPFDVEGCIQSGFKLERTEKGKQMVASRYAYKVYNIKDTKEREVELFELKTFCRENNITCRAVNVQGTTKSLNSEQVLTQALILKLCKKLEIDVSELMEDPKIKNLTEKVSLAETSVKGETESIEDTIKDTVKSTVKEIGKKSIKSSTRSKDPDDEIVQTTTRIVRSPLSSELQKYIPTPDANGCITIAQLKKYAEDTRKFYDFRSPNVESQTRDRNIQQSTQQSTQQNEKKSFKDIKILEPTRKLSVEETKALNRKNLELYFEKAKLAGDL